MRVDKALLILTVRTTNKRIMNRQQKCTFVSVWKYSVFKISLRIFRTQNIYARPCPVSHISFHAFFYMHFITTHRFVNISG